jgi:WhiB family redox-sensing transcriptional regulator
LLKSDLTEPKQQRCNYIHGILLLKISESSKLLWGGLGIAMESRNRVPDNWFVDPIRLGVAGAYSDSENEPLSWQADALCAQTDPEAFFPEKGGSTRDAKRICTGCEVKAQCLDYALKNDERFGIWGGLSERERRKLKKRA